MPRRNPTDRLELLRQKRDQLDAQLKALEARRKQGERKADTRRKVIAGALALEHFQANRNTEFGRVMFRLLDEYVIRPHDRALFPDLPDPAENGANAATEFARTARETAAGNPSPTP